MNTHTSYNPITNKLNSSGSGSIDMSCKKITEAFTSVTPEERKMLWKSFMKRTYSFDFSMLNSKVRHKLTRLGLYQLRSREVTKDAELLKKINKKR
jgi:hypothetical protein